MPDDPRYPDDERDRPGRPGDDVVDVRLLRPVDLLDARLTAPGCTLETEGGASVLVAHGDDASLILHLPPQHLGERAWPDGGQAGLVSPHRAAAPSRVVFALADGARVPFVLTKVLALLPTLPLRVASHATPAAEPDDDARPGWLDHVLVPGWSRVRDAADDATLTDLVLGEGLAGAVASTALHDLAARTVVRAGAARLVRGHAAAVGRPGAAAASRGPSGEVGAEPGTAARRGVVERVVRREPRVRVTPGRQRGPRAPEPDETAIEVPYRVTVSPSVLGAFRHDAGPVTAQGDATRVELWRTHLTTRLTDDDGAFAGHDDVDPTQRVVRAVWSRDMEPLDASASTDPAALHPQSVLPTERRSIVRQTSDVRMPGPPGPLEVTSFALSSLGAWVDWRAAWPLEDVRPSPDPALVPLLDSYRHQAVMGRDSYVRIAKPGFLYPFGHQALWVTVTERKVEDRSQGAAYLWQRMFIIVREPTRTYPGHDTPFGTVTLEPLVTPNLDAQFDLTQPFVPEVDGEPFPFSLVCVDQAGDTVTLSAPLVFVAVDAVDQAAQDGTDITAVADAAYAPVRIVPAGGQTVAVARSAAAGDTAVEASLVRFGGTVDPVRPTSRPWLMRIDAVVPSMRHLAPHSATVPLEYAQPFLAADLSGFGSANPGQVFLSVAGTPPAVDFSGGSDRSGGFLSPNLMVRGLSRTLGAVGEDGTGASGLSQGTFDPATFLDGALPKLFGLFSLLDLLDALGVGLDDAPRFVTEALDAVSAISTEADRLRTAAAEVGPRLVDDASKAAHDGARAAIDAARTQVEAAVAPLLGVLDDVLAAIDALPEATGPVAAAQAIVADLLALADLVDDLLAALGAPALPAAVRASLERPAKALATLARAADLLDTLVAFVEDLLSPPTSVTARLEWRPQIRSWPSGDPDGPVFDARDPRGLRLAVEVRASATTPPAVDVTAELVDFALQLMPGEPLMAMTFQRIGFRVSSGGKPEVDVVFGGMEFLGVLGFVDTLRRLIPFDGFADPPFVDVSPEGVTAGFDLALPNVSVGVFSIENISLGADARVPFLGDAVTVGFSFCSKESPFRLTVMMVGGGGWVALRASPMGLVVLEVGLEAAASLSVDLGVASGSVSVAVGVYLRLEADKGSLTGYFRIRGEVDVLGLISASITLELSLEYQFDTGKMIGRASLVVEVEVLFFSASVEITCERQLAGSKGDPVLEDIYPPTGTGPQDWSEYCAAFAPAA